MKKRILRHVKYMFFAASSILLLKLTKMTTELLQVNFKNTKIERVSEKTRYTIEKIEKVLYPIIGIIL